MGKQITIRGVSDEIAGKLLRLSRERGRSVNAIVLEILGQAVGTDARRERLARYATWTPDDLAQVEQAVASQRVSVEEQQPSRSDRRPLWKCPER